MIFHVKNAKSAILKIISSCVLVEKPSKVRIMNLQVRLCNLSEACFDLGLILRLKRQSDADMTTVGLYTLGHFSTTIIHRMLA